MAQADHAVTVGEVLRHARQLSPVDRIRLIDRIAPEVDCALSVESDLTSMATSSHPLIVPGHIATQSERSPDRGAALPPPFDHHSISDSGSLDLD